MGQIIGSAAKPKRCNLQSLSSLGTPAAGEYILVSSDNSMNAAGQGNFDCYIEGDGQTAAIALPLKKIYTNDVGVKEHYTQGGYLNQQGNVVEDADYCYSDFIPVVGGNQITIDYGNVGQTMYVIYYKANKTYMDYYSLAYTATSRTLNTTASVAFVRFSFSPSYNASVTSNGNTIYKARVDGLMEGHVDEFPSFGGTGFVRGDGIAEYVHGNYVGKTTQQFSLSEQEIARKNIRALYDGKTGITYTEVDAGTGELLAFRYAAYPFEIGKTYLFYYDMGSGDTLVKTYLNVRSRNDQSVAGDIVRLVNGNVNKGFVEWTCNVDNAAYVTINTSNPTEAPITPTVTVIDKTSVNAEVIKNAEDIADINDNIDHVIGSVDLVGSNDWLRTYNVQVKAGRLCRIYLSPTRWNAENKGATANAFIVDECDSEYNTLQTPIHYRYTNLLPVDGIIPFTPTTDYIKVGIRADSGQTIHIDIVQYGVMSQFSDSGETKLDIFSLNGGATAIQNELINLKKPKSFSNSLQGNAILNLIYFSDLHNATDELERILDFDDTFSDYIDDVIHGGDSVLDNWTHDNPFASIDGADRILNIIGNHDNYDPNNTEGDSVDSRVSRVKVFNRFIAPYATTWGVTLPSNAATNGDCYWYKDYVDSKIRLVALNCMEWDSAQATWLQSTLSDARTSELSVIIAVHYCPHRSFTRVTECTFCTVYETPSAFLNNEAAGIVQTAINDGLTFICWLFGHQHNDYFGNLADYPHQYAIAVEKPNYNTGWEKDSIRFATDRTRDSFDIISIDSTLGILSIKRIGNNRDKFLRQKNYLSFDYVNHKIIGNS